jgi:hypothetical protein
MVRASAMADKIEGPHMQVSRADAMRTVHTTRTRSLLPHLSAGWLCFVRGTASAWDGVLEESVKRVSNDTVYCFSSTTCSKFCQVVIGSTLNVHVNDVRLSLDGH